MRVIYGGDGITVAPPPRGEISWKSHDTDLRGGCQWSGAGDICDVLPMCDDITDVPGGRVSGKVKQPGKTQRALHV